MKLKLLRLFIQIFSILMHETGGIKVFEFKKSNNSNSIPFATLQNDAIVELQNNITICTTHKQDKINTIHDRTIYIIYKEESYQSPWFSIGFWTLGRLWANVADEHWYNLGNATSEKFLDWMHICVEIDLNQKTLRASIQQKLFPMVNASGLTPEQKLFLKLGVVEHSSDDKKGVQK